jgi:DtxR family Mn-dependent transcriptional regulator
MRGKTSREDYLRTIYSLYEKSEKMEDGIRSVDLAKSLGVTKPSVSAMLRKLVDLELLKDIRYSNIHLTEKGWEEARRITHNHRVIEVFLEKILGYDAKDVHEEAHRLEHAFSEESIKRLDEYLNNPQTCPHGTAIPHELPFQQSEN